MAEKNNSTIHFGDDTPENSISTENWTQRPQGFPLPMRKVRIPGKLLSSKKKLAFKTNYSVSNGEMPVEIRAFIDRIYKDAMKDRDSSGNLVLTPVIAEDNPWNKAWRFPAGMVIEVVHYLTDGVNSHRAAGYRIDCGALNLCAKWDVKVTPQLWKLYDQKPGGPKLQIEIVSTSDTSTERNVPGKQSPQIVPRMEFRPSPDTTRLTNEWGLNSLASRLFGKKGTGDKGVLARALHWKNRKTDGSSIAITANLFITLTSDERQRYEDAIARKDGQILSIPVFFCVEDAQPVPMQIEIVPHTQSFPGFLSIDFGNSASSIVVFDPSANDREQTRLFPMEQLNHLRTSLFRWFSRNITLHVTQETGVTESVWNNEFLKQLARGLSLNDEDAMTSLKGYLTQTMNSGAMGDKPFFQLLRQVELTLENISDGKQRKILREEMYEFYSQAFLQFPFKSKEMICMKFEQRSEEAGNADVSYTPSDLELTAVFPIPEGNIGDEPKQLFKNWRKSQLTAATAATTENGSPKQTGEIVDKNGSVDKWFTNCPKAFLHTVDRGQDTRIAKDLKLPRFRQKVVGNLFAIGEEHQIYPRTAVQAAWHALLKSVEKKRDDLHLFPGTFETVVATYPATLLPGPRKEIKTLFSELGVLSTDTTFDEAISPTLFYFEQRFGFSKEFGPEAFKVHCLRYPDPEKGDVWLHQMLILDIGAGTTDVAVVQIALRETFSASNEKSGGRFYTIEPQLLGSAGREQCGGHYITLKIFRYLKILLADYLVHHVENEAGLQEPWNILEYGDESDNFKKLLELSEAVLPTRYDQERNPNLSQQERTARLDRFYALWDWAELIKIHLSDEMRKSRKRAREIGYNLAEHWDKFRDKILPGTRFHTTAPKDIFVMFAFNVFETLAKSVLEDSVTQAVNLAKEALAKRQNSLPGLGKDQKLSVDNIVLSGRACQMPFVEELLREKIRKNEQLASERTEILFETEFAKVATASGACLGKRILRAATVGDRKNEIPRLKAGLCDQDLNIKNLFFYLPSTFKKKDGDVMFQMQDEFKQFGFENTGRIRTSAFDLARETTDIMRQDCGFWGQLNVTEIADMAKCSIEHGIYVQYEIDHNLEVQALLLYPDENERVTQPYYLLNSPSAPVQFQNRVDQDKWEKYFSPKGEETTVLKLDIYIGKPSSQGNKPILRKGLEFKETCVEFEPAPDESLDVETPASIQNEKDNISFSDQPMDELQSMLEDVAELERTDASSPNKTKACWSGILNIENRHNLDIYADLGNGEHLLLANFNLKLPQSPEDKSEKMFSFKVEYHLLVTQDGRMNIFIGDTPDYWEVDLDHVEHWCQPGQVLRKNTKKEGRGQLDPEKDPFSGIH